MKEKHSIPVGGVIFQICMISINWFTNYIKLIWNVNKFKLLLKSSSVDLVFFISIYFYIVEFISSFLSLSLSLYLSLSHTHTHAHTYTYIYIYIYICCSGVRYLIDVSRVSIPVWSILQWRRQSICGWHTHTHTHIYIFCGVQNLIKAIKVSTVEWGTKPVS